MLQCGMSRLCCNAAISVTPRIEKGPLGGATLFPVSGGNLREEENSLKQLSLWKQLQLLWQQLLFERLCLRQRTVLQLPFGQL